MKIAKEQIKGIETLAPVASPSFTGTPKAPTPSQSETDTTRLATVGFVRSAVSAGEGGSGGGGGTEPSSNVTYTVEFAANIWDLSVMEYYTDSYAGIDQDIYFLNLDSMEIWKIPAFGGTPAYYATLNEGDKIEMYNATCGQIHFVVHTVWNDPDYHFKTLVPLRIANWGHDTEDVEWGWVGDDMHLVFEPRIYETRRFSFMSSDVSVLIPWQFLNCSSGNYIDVNNYITIFNEDQDNSITVEFKIEDDPNRENRCTTIRVQSNANDIYTDNNIRTAAFTIPAGAALMVNMVVHQYWADPWPYCIVELTGQFLWEQ